VLFRQPVTGSIVFRRQGEIALKTSRERWQLFAFLGAQESKTRFSVARNRKPALPSDKRAAIARAGRFQNMAVIGQEYYTLPMGFRG